MPRYERPRAPGGTYFSPALADWRSDGLVREIATCLAAFARTRLRYPFLIDVWVVLPEQSC